MLITLKELAPLIGRTYSAVKIYSRLSDFPHPRDLTRVAKSAFARRWDKDEVLAWWTAHKPAEEPK